MKQAHAYKEDGTLVQLIGKGKSGGEGTFFKIKLTNINGLKGEFGAKIYHNNCRTQERCDKLKFMINNKPDNRVFEHQQLRICWPVALLYDNPNGNFIGFVMYHAFENSRTMEDLAIIVNQRRFNVQLSQGAKSNDDKLIIEKFVRCQQASDIKSLLNRLKVLSNIATIFHYLHTTQKYVAVDVKPPNLLINSKGHVSLVDIDSIQISENSNLLFPCKVHTPEYAPPEFYISKNINIPELISLDLFAIAVMFYEILIGVHPYMCTPKSGKDFTIPDLVINGFFCHGKNKSKLNFAPPHKLFDYLPSNIQTLFFSAFEDKPENRPQAIVWRDELKTVIDDWSSKQPRTPHRSSNQQSNYPSQKQQTHPPFRPKKQPHNNAIHQKIGILFKKFKNLYWNDFQHLLLWIVLGALLCFVYIYFFR